MALTDQQETLKQDLIDTGEEWDSTWETLLKLDQDYFAAYVGLRKVPRSQQHLPLKFQELVLLAMDAACTHLYEPGIRLHTQQALKAGATEEEILETLQLSSVLGIHAVTMGVPTLLEVLRENGRDIPRDLNERQEKLKAEFTKNRGYWSKSWDPVIRLSPDFFEAYTNFSSVPFLEGHQHLDAKTKEFMYTAIDCSTTHLFQPGLKVHLQNAVRLGATNEEIMEVFALASTMGGQTMHRGVSALMEASEHL